MPSNRPLRPPSSLSSLPVEILTLIVLRLDRNSAISLARVARIFTPIADHRIYRELDLFLPPHWGEYPLVLPRDLLMLPRGQRILGPEYRAYMSAEAAHVDYRRRRGLKDKVNGILKRAGERRLGMVERVVIVPRPDAVHAILSLLDNISSNLKTIQLEVPRNPSHGHPELYEPRESFDVKLLGYNLSLSALTHLYITAKSALYAETAIILCKAAPNLVALTAEFQGRPDVPTWDNEFMPRPPGYRTELRLPKLLYIKMSFDDREDEGGHHPLLAILRGSPAVRQVSLRYWCEDAHLELFTSLSEKEDLRDLYLNASPIEFQDFLSGERTSGFPSLRRLVLESYEPTDIFKCCIALPCLETLHIERPEEELLRPRNSSSFLESTTSNFTMIPTLASGLRGSPRLSTINFVDSIPSDGDLFAHLDHVEAAGDLTGFVRSFVHGEEELLHVRLLHDYEEVGDHAGSAEGRGGCSTVYTAKDGSERKRMYVWHDEAEWYEWLELDGCKVPPKILRKMRKAEGASCEEWQGRGVEVGAEAWEILTDWRATEKWHEEA